MDLAAVQKEGFDTSNTNDSIFDMLFNQDELSWQHIIYELVRNEEMDPWDIDLGVIAKKYLQMLSKLKAMDFRVSGKVILAAALLLKLKSNRLVGTELNELTRLMNTNDDEFDEDYEDYDEEPEQVFSEDDVQEVLTEEPKLVPKTPQPRDRKVSVFDLVSALDQALKVNKRRGIKRKSEPVSHEKPKKDTNLSVLTDKVYKTLNQHLNKKKTVMFSQLVQEGEKKDKVFTFIPLLHLTNQQKIDMKQEDHLKDISIMLMSNKKEIDKQLKKKRQAPKTKYFKTKDGQVLKDIEDLAIYLEGTNLRIFKHHVNEKRNDFAQWVKDALKEEKVAKKLNSTCDYHETMSHVLNAL